MMHDGYWMGGGGLFVWLIAAVLIVVPFWRILPRAGIPSWLAVVAVFPLAALILLWIMAFKSWPGDEGAA